MRLDQHRSWPRGEREADNRYFCDAGHLVERHPRLRDCASDPVACAGACCLLKRVAHVHATGSRCRPGARVPPNQGGSYQRATWQITRRVYPLSLSVSGVRSVARSGRFGGPDAVHHLVEGLRATRLYGVHPLRWLRRARNLGRTSKRDVDREQHQPFLHVEGATASKPDCSGRCSSGGSAGVKSSQILAFPSGRTATAM